MTTVAFRNGVMVGDSLMTRNDHEKIFGFRKVDVIAREDDDWLIGFAGDPTYVRMVHMLLSEMDTPFDPLPPEMKDAGITILLYSNRFGLVDVDYPGGLEIPSEFYAIGSGSSYAMGAMAAGATAREAVEVACQYDAFSGGEIMEVVLT